MPVNKSTDRDPEGRNRPMTTGGASAGGFPDPGGNVDPVDVPPYEGRSKGTEESETTRAKTESVERQVD